MEWALLALSPARDKGLAFVTGLHYFALVFNGSRSLEKIGRDMDATTRDMAQPARSVSTEEIPIDEWFARNAAQLWADYESARAATSNLAQLRRLMPDALRDHETRLLKVRNEARAALDAWLADRSGRSEIEVWARPGSRIEDPRCIPPSAVRVLEFDYEERTASGKGLPLLYDVHVRQAATVTATARWAFETTERLLAKGKIPKDLKWRSELADLLATESKKAVKAGQLSRALKASYLENQLGPWGIWDLVETSRKHINALGICFEIGDPSSRKPQEVSRWTPAPTAT